MIVECSKCKTSFKVDQNLISQKAKVFQCSLCKNVWAIENDQAFTKIKDKKLKEDLESIRNEIEYKKNIFKKKTSDQILSEIDDSYEKEIDEVLEIPAFLRR